MKHYVAGDLGAESGRVILGSLHPQGILDLREIHRFSNGPTEILGSLRWNLLGLFADLKTGLKKIAAEKIQPSSFSIDTWGVDYVWFNQSEPMLALPYHYRDGRTDLTYQDFVKKARKELIFEETGIQFMQLNTLFQFAADVAAKSPALTAATGFLCIADYLNFLFSGVALAEVSLASTTQIYNPKTRNWSKKLIDLLELPEKIFPKICPSSTIAGPLTSAIAKEVGLSDTKVILTCSHDTGAAVAAVPAEGENWAYLSSGTWSLIGVELDEPLINAAVLEKNFTNEIGAENKIRFLKNIVGLWILQESRRHWAAEGIEYDYNTLTHMAEESAPLVAFLDPSDPTFFKPGNMPEHIQAFLTKTNQPQLTSHGAIVRSICESLALSYRKTLEELEALTGKSIDTIHIVGGGSKNRLLNQFTANATGRRVIAGPVEATAAGNILLQAVAMGDLPNLTALRTVVRNSFDLEEFQPSGDSQWQQAYQRYLTLS